MARRTQLTKGGKKINRSADGNDLSVPLLEADVSRSVPAGACTRAVPRASPAAAPHPPHDTCAALPCKPLLQLSHRCVCSVCVAGVALVPQSQEDIAMTGMSRRKRSDVGSPKSAAGGLGQPEDPNEAYIMHILEPHHTLAGIALQYRCVYARAAAACCVRVPAPAHAVWGGHRKDASTLARALAHLLGTRTGPPACAECALSACVFPGRARCTQHARAVGVHAGSVPCSLCFFSFPPWWRVDEWCAQRMLPPRLAVGRAAGHCGLACPPHRRRPRHRARAPFPFPCLPPPRAA